MFPPPKLKKARVGATVLVVRRPVETVGRVVTLVPVANADIIANMMMDGWYRTRVTLRPSVRHCGDRIAKKPLRKTTPSDEANGKGSRTSCKVGRQRVGRRGKKAVLYVYTESTVHDSTDQTICRQEVHIAPSFVFFFFHLLPKKKESLVLVES